MKLIPGKRRRWQHFFIKNIYLFFITQGTERLCEERGTANFYKMSPGATWRLVSLSALCPLLTGQESKTSSLYISDAYEPRICTSFRYPTHEIHVEFRLSFV